MEGPPPVVAVAPPVAVPPPLGEGGGGLALGLGEGEGEGGGGGRGEGGGGEVVNRVEGGACSTVRADTQLKTAKTAVNATEVFIWAALDASGRPATERVKCAASRGLQIEGFGSLGCY